MSYLILATPVHDATARVLCLARAQEQLEARFLHTPALDHTLVRNYVRPRIWRAHQEVYDSVHVVGTEQILNLIDPTIPRRGRYLLQAYWRTCIRLKACGVGIPVAKSKQVSATLEAWRWLQPDTDWSRKSGEGCL